MVMGILVFIYIFTHPKMVVLGGTDGSGVGPGFFPFICAAALTILGLLLFLKGVRENGSVDYFALTEEKKKNLIMVACMAAFIVVFLILWKVTKRFFIILPIYSFAINMLFKRSLLFSVVFAAAITAAIYGLFGVGFTIRFMP